MYGNYHKKTILCLISQLKNYFFMYFWSCTGQNIYEPDFSSQKVFVHVSFIARFVEWWKEISKISLVKKTFGSKEKSNKNFKLALFTIKLLVLDMCANEQILNKSMPNLHTVIFLN